MFVRTKKIGGKEYAYLVENRKAWGKVKQRSKKYLGRVYRFDIVNVAEFYEFHGIDPEDVSSYLDSNGVRKILIDLISTELYKHGFNKVDGRKLLWSNGEIFADLRENKFYTSRGMAALGFNEGFLCRYYVSKLMNFRVSTEDDAVRLAKIFVEAGINVPKGIYVGIFDKLSAGKSLFEYYE